MHVLTGSGGGKPEAVQRRLRGIDADRAREFLTGVLADMLGGEHAYLLPCEAVFDYLAKGTPVAESVATMIDDGKRHRAARGGARCRTSPSTTRPTKTPPER